MTEPNTQAGSPRPDGDASDNAAVARSAGLAFLGRLGALIDIVSLSVFGWLYGAANMGLFFVLWAALRVLTRFTEFGMPTVLQRFVPANDRPDRAAAIVKSALVTALLLSVVLALVIMVLAETLAGTIHAGPEDAAHAVAIIRIQACVLPFWTLLEVLTASVRAQRQFGPEVRIRVFYEQGLRFVAGVLFFALGFHSKGLFLAHLTSAVLAALLALRLSARFYDYRAILTAPLDRALTRRMLSYAAPIMPVGMIRDLHAEVPVLLLNQLLPGAQGAASAGLYATARRIVSVLLVVRQSFEYVIAPYATKHQAAQQHEALREMYAFSTRLICCLVVPLGALLLLVRDQVLLAFAPDFAAAGAVILVLALGRMLESLTGPANALIEMLGQRMLPLVNGLAGVVLMVALQLLLTPGYGAMGAAAAVAVGVNVTSYASLLQAWLLYDLQPYDRAFLKPFSVAIASTLLVVWLGSQAGLGELLGDLTELAAISLGVWLTLALTVRYGFRPEDVQALGRVGRWLRGGARAGG